jgi:hypothetical protein
MLTVLDALAIDIWKIRKDGILANGLTGIYEGRGESVAVKCTGEALSVKYLDKRYDISLINGAMACPTWANARLPAVRQKFHLPHRPNLWSHF